MPFRFWQELTTTAFSAWDKERTVLILPVGSVEQHGPHLPVCVDACLVEGMVAQVMARGPQDLSVLVLPLLPVGKANEHKRFDGTLCLSAQTLISLWTEVAESALRAGFRKILILNGHGGQTAVTQIVARDLRVSHNALAVAIDWWSLRSGPSPFPEEEQVHGIHAGAEETSLMLRLRPDLVKMEKIDNFLPASLSRKEEFPFLYGQRRFGWQAQDLHEGGAMGDARLASAALGQEILDECADSILALLQEMARFPLASLNRHG